MWAVAAQPRTGLTPMIPTPNVDSGIGHLCVCSFAALEPRTSSTRTTVMISRLIMRTLFTALWMPYAACARASSRGERVVVDPAQAFLEVRHDLLRPRDADDSPGAAGVRSELAAAHRGRQQRSGLGDRVDAAEHHVRRRGQAADLVGPGVAVQAPDPWSNGVVAGGPLDLIDDSRNLERLRRATVHLRSIRDEIEDDPFRFGRGRRPEHPDAVVLEGRRGPG